jgi:hypothetical protein
MTGWTSSAQTRDNKEREEAQTMIACGFDVRRAQITFDLVDHQTGGFGSRPDRTGHARAAAVVAVGGGEGAACV